MKLENTNIFTNESKISLVKQTECV